MEKNMENNKLASEIYNQFENATSFIDNLNLRKEIARCINFYEGRQWNMDDDIADFPKIVLNIIKQIGQVRGSGLQENTYSFLVDSSNEKSVRKIQDFMKRLHFKLKMREKDRKIIKDVYKKGTGISYFYWDAQGRDILSKSGGKLKAELVDIRRFRVADPYIQDLQEQEWVAFVSRERIDALIRQYDLDEESLSEDGEDYTTLTEKPVYDDVKKNLAFVNVYTKFYRNNEGQVFYIITTKDVVLDGPAPLNPFYKSKNDEEQPNTTSLQDNKKTNDKLEEAVFNLYPFASLVFDERDNCFYGIPGILENIETQKSINQHFSVYDKGIQDNVLGGFVMRRGILGDQELTTDNGQIIELDMMPNENWSNLFGRIPVNNIPTDALNYSQNLLGVVKSVNGATNVQIGQSDYSGQSGKQTQMLIERARENTTDLAQTFNDFKVRQAEIMFLFAKFFYDNEPFVVIEHGKDSNTVVADYKKEPFNGNEFLDDDVDFNIQVTPSQQMSEASLMQILSLSIQTGKIELFDYVDMVPEGYFPNRLELKKKLQQGNMVIMKQMEQKNEQLTEIIQTMTKEFNKFRKDLENFDVVVKENQNLKNMLVEMAAKNIGMDKEQTKKIVEKTQEQ